MSIFSKDFHEFYKSSKKRKSPTFLSSKDKRKKKKIQEIKKREKVESFFLTARGESPTFFHHLSIELFQLLIEAYLWAEKNDFPYLSTDVVTLHILSHNLKTSKLFAKKSIKNYEKLLKDNFSRILKEVEAKKKKNLVLYFLKKTQSFLRNLVRKILKKKPRQNYSFCFSLELVECFEKAAYLAENEFKTPFITPEIFFLALSDHSPTKAQSIFQQIFPTRGMWQNFKYNLVKNIFAQDYFAKKNIADNQLVFFYFFRKNLSHVFLTQYFISLQMSNNLDEKISLTKNFFSLVQVIFLENFRKKKVSNKNLLLQYYCKRKVFSKINNF